MLLIQSDFTFLFFLFFLCACVLWGARAPSCRGPRAPCTCLAPAPRTSPGRVQEILGALHVLQSCCDCVDYKTQKGGGRAQYFSSLTHLTQGGGGGAEGHEAKPSGSQLGTRLSVFHKILVKTKLTHTQTTTVTNIINKVYSVGMFIDCTGRTEQTSLQMSHHLAFCWPQAAKVSRLQITSKLLTMIVRV